MQRTLSIDEYYDGVLSGNRVILSKAITLIESNKKEDQILSQKLIEKIIPHTGNSMRIGITGVPGVGKSTFIESFGELLIEEGNKIAVLAIDPSSQKTRGSILGDKTRMEKLSYNTHAFIRPSASGNSLGGVANKTRETVLLCEAFGCDIILIETVGVGQSEVSVKNMTDFFLLLMLAGAGDELQGIKKGIMEMADLITITKADGKNLTLSQKAKVEYENAIHLFPPNANEWIPHVETCSAINNEGLKTIWNSILKYKSLTQANGSFTENRINQNKHWFKELIQEKIYNEFFQHPLIKEEVEQIDQKISSSNFHLNKEVERLYKLYKEN